MKRSALLSALITVGAASGLLLGVESASAADFKWDNSWTQPQVLDKQQTGFDVTPYQVFVQPDTVPLQRVAEFQVDPKRLLLKNDYDVSIYFVNERASYRNQLAYQATGGLNQSGLVFNDVSCNDPVCVNVGGGNALKLGDGIKLGKIPGNTQLDLWLRADGLNNGDSSNLYSTQTSPNPDKLQHAVAYVYNDYLLVGFEDLYGPLKATGKDPSNGRSYENSDRDFNDVVFAVDIGRKNIEELKKKRVPEPTVTLSLLGVAAAALINSRRRVRKVS
ncbi:MAG: DUF4114 domain-containing protein [Scytonematopsis contorta HA4267-MV1]|nr:DUF4114 domain-containing protein [Scytonematopsis contorta HA4267-MV1]